MKIKYLVLGFVLFSVEANADSSNLDAAVGGGIGGAAGAAIGNEVWGRDGAILGGGVGAAVGAAIATDDEEHGSRHGRHRHYRDHEVYQHVDDDYEMSHHYARPRIPNGHMPPPGQCRVWYPERTPGHQPPPGDCRSFGHRIPAGTWLVRG